MTKLKVLSQEDQPKVTILDIHVGSRLRKDMGDLKDLAESLSEDGLIHPIALRPPTPEEREGGVTQPYVLVAGGRRMAAALMLGWKEIPAHVREDMTELKARTLELMENLKRHKMSWEEEVKSKEEIYRLRQAEDPNITQGQVAAELGMSGATLTRDLQTAEAIRTDPTLKKASSKNAALRAKKVSDLKNTGSEAKGDWRKTKINDVSEKLHIGEMQEWLKALKLSSVDLICADLPYGIDYFKAGHKSDPSKQLSGFDDRMAPTMDLYVDIVPKMVHAMRESGWIVCFTSRELFPFLGDLFKNTCFTHADYRSESHPTKCKKAQKKDRSNDCRFLVPEPVEWFWYRPNSRNNPRHPEFHARNEIERMLVVNMGKAILHGETPVSNVIEVPQVYGGNRVHVNQKPLDLYKEIIKRTTMIGDLVVDPCFGSGSCLAAAAASNREFAGCERNEGMKGPAVGLVVSNLQIMPTNYVTEAKRHKQALLASDLDEAIYDFEEVEEAKNV